MSLDEEIKPEPKPWRDRNDPPLRITTDLKDRRNYIPWILGIVGLASGLFIAYETNKNLLTNYAILQTFDYIALGSLGFYVPYKISKRFLSK